jgi:hypothetical protein
MSAIPVVAQFRKYIQPATYAPFSPRNSRAYDTKAPEDGEDAAHRVRDEEGGAGVGEPAARAEEEAGADGTADGDHVDVPGLQRLAVTRVSGVDVRGRFAGRCGLVFEGLLAHASGPPSVGMSVRAGRTMSVRVVSTRSR